MLFSEAFELTGQNLDSVLVQETVSEQDESSQS